MDLELDIRVSDTMLAATHRELLAGGRWKPIAWDGFDASRFTPRERAVAIANWNQRLADEYRSTALFSQLQTLLLLAGMPLDVGSACARVVADELRHVQLCAEVVTALGGTPVARLPVESAYLLVDPAAPLAPQLVEMVVNLLCLGESVSARLIGASKEATTSPEIREVLARLHADEAFHGEFGWQLAPLLLAEADVAVARARLPAALHALEQACLGTYAGGDAGEAGAFDAAGLGALTIAAHRAVFYRAIEEAVLPRLDGLDLAGTLAWSKRGGRSC